MKVKLKFSLSTIKGGVKVEDRKIQKLLDVYNKSYNPIMLNDSYIEKLLVLMLQGFLRISVYFIYTVTELKRNLNKIDYPWWDSIPQSLV